MNKSETKSGMSHKGVRRRTRQTLRRQREGFFRWRSPVGVKERVGFM